MSAMKITRVKSEVYQVPTHREIHDAARHFNKLGLVLANVETVEKLGLGRSRRDRGLGSCSNRYRYMGLEIKNVGNAAL